MFRVCTQPIRSCVTQVLIGWTHVQNDPWLISDHCVLCMHTANKVLCNTGSHWLNTCTEWSLINQWSLCSVYAHSQWEAALQCNTGSHWPSAYQEWSLIDNKNMTITSSRTQLHRGNDNTFTMRRDIQVVQATQRVALIIMYYSTCSQIGWQVTSQYILLTLSMTADLQPIRTHQTNTGT